MSTQEQQARGGTRGDARWREARRLAEGALEKELELQDLYLQRVSFRLDGFQVMAIAKLETGNGERLVGFHTAASLEGAIWGMLKGLHDGRIKLRKDKPWQGKER